MKGHKHKHKHTKQRRIEKLKEMKKYFEETKQTCLHMLDYIEMQLKRLEKKNGKTNN